MKATFQYASDKGTDQTGRVHWLVCDFNVHMLYARFSRVEAHYFFIYAFKNIDINIS